MVTMTDAGPFMNTPTPRRVTLLRRCAVPANIFFLIGVPLAWLTLRFVTGAAGWFVIIYLLGGVILFAAQFILVIVMTRSKRHTPDGYPPQGAAVWSYVSALFHVATALSLDDFGDVEGAFHSYVSSATNPSIGFTVFAICALIAILAYLLSLISAVRAMMGTKSSIHR